MKNEILNQLRDAELSDLLKAFSQRTWRRLGFSWSCKNKVKTYETTITQNLVFELLEFVHLTETPVIRILEARDENANGNDIEVFVQHGNSYILFPTRQKACTHQASTKKSTTNQAANSKSTLCSNTPSNGRESHCTCCTTTIRIGSTLRLGKTIWVSDTSASAAR